MEPISLVTPLAQRRQPPGDASLLVTCAIWLLAFCGGVTRAELFELQNGGQLEGRWTNQDDMSNLEYVIQTPLGGIIRIAKATVRQVRVLRPEEVEYDQRAPGVENTLPEQWKLAEWCRLNKLRELRELHLRRILELDPDCPEARHGLGYTQIEGRWVTSGEVPRERGLEYHTGRWRLPQEIEALEQRSRTKQLTRDWLVRLKSQRRSLTEAARLAQFRADVAAIRDPHAIRALLQLLRVESIPALRLWYVIAIAEIEHDQAVETLINISLESSDLDVTHKCIECLLARQAPGVVDAYVLALRDVRNPHVNRAAFALGEFADSTAIGPLIEALITRHRVVFSEGDAAGGQTATFSRNLSPSGNGQDNAALSTGKGPHIVMIPVQNAEVLSALNRITGIAGYGFDQRSWQIWYAAQRRVPGPTPTRRD